MNTVQRVKVTWIGIMLLVILFGVACGSAPTATPVPTRVLATAVPTATVLAVAPTKAPTPAVAPAAVPATTAPTAAVDVKTALDRYLSSLPDTWGLITPAFLRDQMEAAKPFVVDLRDASEIATAGYIQGTVNIPIRTLLKNLDRLPAKDQPVIVMCDSEHRGALGMAALQLLGYANVKSLQGGFSAWKAAKLPVATGTPPEAKAGTAPTADRSMLDLLDRYLANLPEDWGTITPTALNAHLQTKPFQLDVRESRELSLNGYLADSVNVPIRTLVKSLDQLPSDKATPIVAECGSGHRSAIAMMALNFLGYTNVKSLVGGFNAWKAANLPISK